eukprot:TRINITY_DN22845_c0_g1_i1.p1 TRINITY_DN22845_c0_g1~~TRINITY_DN22845_c0_g1_i1.p1  ORF type:complete len:882 (+),score=126.48 TRINITY_DN22845_c0_g1_i1:134-2779(+)
MESLPQTVAGSFASFRGKRLSHRVPVVSQEEELRSATCWVLDLLGCAAVQGFASPEELASKLVSSADHVAEASFNLVLCDLEQASALLASTPGCGVAAVVLVCPKRMNKQLLSSCLDSGARGYVAKPLRVQAIRGVLVRYLGEPDDAGGVSPGGGGGGGPGKYERVKTLGVGSCGEVSLVKRARDGVCFAMKEVHIATMGAGEQQKVLEELRLHKAFDCPCVVRYYTSWMQDDVACLLLEYVENGSLSGEIRRCRADNREVSDACAVDWAGQMILGLLYLHKKEVVHRDLKSDNVLGPDPNNCVKIADFGISKRLKGAALAKSLVGTLEIMAPERLRGIEQGIDAEPAEYGAESDLWSLGVVLYELATLKMPFSVPECEEPAQVKQQRLIARICGEEPEPLPFSRAAVLHKVVTGGLLRKRPSERPTASDLCRDQDLGSAIHRFLKRQKLLSHPSILEVVDVLPGEATEGSCIASSDLDVISFRHSSKNGHRPSLLSCNPSLEASSNYLDSSRMQLSELSGLFPKEFCEVLASTSSDYASTTASTAAPARSLGAEDLTSHKSNSQNSNLIGENGISSEKTAKQSLKVPEHSSERAPIQRQKTQDQLEHRHKTRDGSKPPTERSAGYDDEFVSPPPVPPAMPPPPEGLAQHSSDPGCLRLSLPVPAAAWDTNMSPKKTESGGYADAAFPGAPSKQKRRHRSSSRAKTQETQSCESPWSQMHPTPPRGASTTGDRFLDSCPPLLQGFRQQRATSASALVGRGNPELSLPLPRRHSRSKLDPLDSPPKTVPACSHLDADFALGKKSPGDEGRSGRSRSAATLEPMEAVAPRPAQSSSHLALPTLRMSNSRASSASSMGLPEPSGTRTIDGSRRCRSSSSVGLRC